MNLKPCPFCGGEVSIALTGQGVINWLFVTRGNSKSNKNCNCRVFMESDRFHIDRDNVDAEREKAMHNLVESWNRRQVDKDDDQQN